MLSHELKRLCPRSISACASANDGFSVLDAAYEQVTYSPSTYMAAQRCGDAEQRVKNVPAATGRSPAALLPRSRAPTGGCSARIPHTCRPDQFHDAIKASPRSMDIVCAPGTVGSVVSAIVHQTGPVIVDAVACRFIFILSLSIAYPDRTLTPNELPASNLE